MLSKIAKSTLTVFCNSWLRFFKSLISSSALWRCFPPLSMLIFDTLTRTCFNQFHTHLNFVQGWGCQIQLKMHPMFIMTRSNDIDSLNWLSWGELTHFTAYKFTIWVLVLTKNAPLQLNSISFEFVYKLTYQLWFCKLHNDQLSLNVDVVFWNAWVFSWINLISLREFACWCRMLMLPTLIMSCSCTNTCHCLCLIACSLQLFNFKCFD